MKTSDARKLVAVIDRVAAERAKRKRSSKPPRVSAKRSLSEDGSPGAGSPAIVDRYWIGLDAGLLIEDFDPFGRALFGYGLQNTRTVVDGIEHVSGPDLGSLTPERLVPYAYEGKLGNQT